MAASLLDRVADLERRVANMIRPGIVKQVKARPYRAVVSLASGDGEVLTDPLPIAAPAAGTVKVWTPLAVGERVLVVNLGGDSSHAVAIPAVYSSEFEPPSQSLGEIRVDYAGGSLSIDMASGLVTLAGDLRVSGNMSVGGDMATDAKGGFNGHKHEYLLPEHPAGPANTTEPVAAQ